MTTDKLAAQKPWAAKMLRLAVLKLATAISNNPNRCTVLQIKVEDNINKTNDFTNKS